MRRTTCRANRFAGGARHAAKRPTMSDSSTPTGVLVLDAVVFIGGVAILTVVIVWFARRIFSDK
ncbi:MAG: hypothetical protein NVSMB19_13160 [Vulcanimicrobiaceae bacterium]